MAISNRLRARKVVAKTLPEQQEGGDDDAVEVPEDGEREEMIGVNSIFVDSCTIISLGVDTM